jgi:hypothetical protein
MKFREISMSRKNIAPIRSAVEVISVTPVSISELETQKQATGINRIPIMTDRRVILL